MGITRESALKILQLNPGSSDHKIIQHFKILSLQHFPREKAYSEESLKIFGELCQAAAFLLDYKYQDIVKPKDMFSFFQYLFFKNQNEYGDPSEEGDVHQVLCVKIEDNSDDLSDEIFNDTDDDHDDFINDEKSSQGVFPNEIKNEITAVENANKLILEEERVRKKAEKKKSQKKKRKEKKKKEKLAEQTKSQPISKDNESSDNGEKENSPESSSESEEDIDTNSAFVAVVAKKKRQKNSQTSKKEINKPVSSSKALPLIQEDPMARTLRSRQLAVRGNEMASAGYYNEAIELFSEAIKIDSSDHRFYGNRSYCYDKVGNYDRALQDANKSIEISPIWAKGYFRKGKALANLRNLTDADECFTKVLELDPECDDAVKEKHNLKIIQLMEMGFSKIQAELGLEKHKTVAKALDFLLTKYQHSGGIRLEPDVYVSDEDDEIAQYFKNIRSSPSARTIDKQMDPSNPDNHSSLWIGNVQPEVTESILISLFSRHGDILSIRIMHDTFCAFINYKNPKSTGNAMKALQGIELCGHNLLLRYPNKNDKNGAIPKSGSTKEKFFLTGDECYFWRTTGCTKGTSCKFKHVPKSKGIDIDKIR